MRRHAEEQRNQECFFKNKRMLKSLITIECAHKTYPHDTFLIHYQSCLAAPTGDDLIHKAHAYEYDHNTIFDLVTILLPSLLNLFLSFYLRHTNCKAHPLPTPAQALAI